MKNRIQIGFAILAVAFFVCSVASAFGTIPWTSEGGGLNTCDVAGDAAHSLYCAGGWCADLMSDCETPAYPLAADAPPIVTPYFSEEEVGQNCPAGYIVNGYDLFGYDDRGDDIALNCIKTDNYIEDDCQWTPWISEEPETPSGAPLPYAGTTVDCHAYFSTDHYIHGMECNNGWCDNMRLYCCSYKEKPATVEPCDPDDPATVDLGSDGQETWVRNDACLKVEDSYPPWWGHHAIMKFQNAQSTSGAYPVTVDWGNDCTSDSGSFSYSGDWQDQWMSYTDMDCPTVIKLNGSGSGWIKVRYYKDGE